MSGDTLIAGAINDRGPRGNALKTGAVYVFERSPDGRWRKTHKLHGSGTAGGSEFGFAVDIEGDRLIAGARGSAGDGSAVYVFEETDSSWIETAVLTDPMDSESSVGWSVDLQADQVIAGAPQKTFEGVLQGAAYVFSQVDQGWVLKQVLTPSDPSGSDFFGVSVGLAGSLAVVGAPLNDAVAQRGGAVYVFEEAAGVWQEQTKLVPQAAQVDDRFGTAVAFDELGIVVGTDPPAGVINTGAYVYVRDGLGLWAERRLRNCGGSNNFGRDVAIHEGRLVVGDNQFALPGESTGAAFLFRRSGSSGCYAATRLGSGASYSPPQGAAGP